MPESAKVTYGEFDKLLAIDGPVMVVGQQFLKPPSFDPTSEIVFPPSYANPSEKSDDPAVYNIDQTDPSDPSKNVCVLDSIPSQANRMEPLFSSPPYDSLVPQYKVRLTEDADPVSILNVGHRLADAVFRGTTLRDEIVAAFKAYAKGNAAPIARLGGTSLVFGVWDSRGTGVKVPRLINSIIRAFDVTSIRRSAQYSPPIKYEQEGLIPAGLDGKPSDHGLADVPSSQKIGGVQIKGDIRRDVSLNLAVLRALKGKDADETKKLQRYILALSLIALTATPDSTLRQGCQLLPKSKAAWRQFKADGEEMGWNPDGINLVEFAKVAAADLGIVQPQNQPLVFDKTRLKASIDADAKKKADKKAKNVGNPGDILTALIEGLEPNSTGTKLNAGPVKKLQKYLEAVQADDDMKPMADQMLAVLGGSDAPVSRIQKLTGLLPSGTGSSDEGELDQTDDTGDSQ